MAPPLSMQCSFVEWADSKPPVAVLMGRTEAGESAALVVRGFLPYFYVVPAAFDWRALTDLCRASLVPALEDRLRGKRDDRHVHSSAVKLAAWSVERRTPVDEYRTEPANVVKLVFGSAEDAGKARSALTSPLRWMDRVLLAQLLGRPPKDAIDADAMALGWHMPVSEGITGAGHSLDGCAEKCTIDAGIYPEAWLSWPVATHKVERRTTATHEAHVTFSELEKMKLDKSDESAKAC